MKVKRNFLFTQVKVVGEEKSFGRKLITVWKLASRKIVNKSINQGPKGVGLKKFFAFWSLGFECRLIPKALQAFLGAQLFYLDRYVDQESHRHPRA